MIETINSPFKSRERILGYGHEGTGKSSALLSIARHCPDNTFYIIDNDNAYDRLLETDFKDVLVNGNIRRAGDEFGRDPSTWKGSIASIAEALDAMGRDDWLVVDMLSKQWDGVQEWFIESAFKEDIDDYFLRIRIEKERLKGSGEKDAKSLGALEGWMDWPVINQTYHKRVSRPLLNCPGHLFCVSASTKIGKEETDRSIIELYGTVGSRPAGQKGSGHLMQTVIMFNKNMRSQEFKLTTVKDRGRVVWNDEVFEDFAMDYLVHTGGWEVKRSFVKAGG